MKKYNLYKYILIVFISIFILVPRVKAKTITTTYNNYYFFLEPYKLCFENESDCDATVFGGNASLKGSDNETGFIQLELGASSGNYTRIDLFNDSKWNLEKFYNTLINIENNGKEKSYEPLGTTCSTKYIEKAIKETKTEKIVDYYYSHGCYRKYGTGDWNGGVSSWVYTQTINQLACASINSNIGENSIFEYRNANTSNAYLYSRIIRNNTTVNNIQNTSNNGNISNCNGEVYPIYVENKYRILSPVLYKYTYTVTEEVCDPSLTKPNIGKCNSGGNTLSSTCQKQTVATNNSRADVSISQTGTVANILTPDSVYQGGGFKLGFVYYNEISWDFAGEILTTLGSQYAAKSEITSEMKKKIQNLEDLQKNIILDNISFGDTDEEYEILNSNLIQKECKINGDFNPGETVTTVCTFYLPNSVVDFYTGKVTYGTSIGTNYRINNKYYTPLTYEGEYNIKATLKNLSILKDNEDWTGDWNITFDGEQDDSCQIDVYGMLYSKPKFIYRPIDLTNPFPSRNAGINWFDWYKNLDNRDELKKSYSDLEYSFNLNNEKLSSIKNYNNQKDTEGTGYFNWDDIEDGKSSFVDIYAEKVGDNS